MVNYISNIWNLQYENCSSYCPKSNQNMYTSKHLQWYYYMWYRISTSVKINWFKRLTWLYIPHFKKKHVYENKEQKSLSSICFRLKRRSIPKWVLNALNHSWHWPFKLIWDHPVTFRFKEREQGEPKAPAPFVTIHQRSIVGQRVIIQEQSWGEVKSNENIDGVMFVCG